MTDPLEHYSTAEADGAQPKTDPRDAYLEALHTYWDLTIKRDAALRLAKSLAGPAHLAHLEATNQKSIWQRIKGVFQ